jgi:D-alanyl-D-alanine carboxypeptidase/D-alanyl-D-alanine-endopeptidase (penicillin-binding protein 4)
MPKTIARLLSVRLRKEALFYKDHVFLALFLLVASRNLFAQPVTQPPPQRTPKEIASFEELRKDITGILQDPAVRNAFWGISIQSLKTGESFFELNEKKSFIPASNLKLVTSAAALTLLSPSFQFTTELFTNGKVVKGVLKGDLIVRGAGDPTFGSPSMYPEKDPTFVFKAWADTLTKHGIQKIEGNIIADDSYFTDDEYPIGWSIDDASYSYAMQTSALSFADNSVSVSVSPNLSPGSKPFVATIPETDYIEKNNTAVTLDPKKLKDSSAANTITVMRDLGTNTINISGEIAKGTPATLEQISVESPSLYAGNVLREVIQYEGITVTGGTMTSAELKEKIPYQSLQMLAQNVSPPLGEIVTVMNKKSNNFYAELSHTCKRSRW